jgi:uncharacterized damage-inducible protein DinB
VLNYLRELLQYTEWADAEFLRSWKTLPAAHSDHEMLVRADHHAQVQSAFLKLLKSEDAPRPSSDSEPPELQTILENTKDNHRHWGEYIRTVSQDDLSKPLNAPWFAQRPIKPTYLETITQVVMHCMHHRAQNLARLRTFGGDRVIVDHIRWVMSGKPAANWE